MKDRNRFEIWVWGIREGYYESSFFYGLEFGNVDGIGSCWLKGEIRK